MTHSSLGRGIFALKPASQRLEVHDRGTRNRGDGTEYDESPAKKSSQRMQNSYNGGDFKMYEQMNQDNWLH
jgi:hypothetical protein